MRTDQLRGTTRKVLELLGFLGTASPSQLANRIGHSVQNISTVLKKLEETGLVKCVTPDKRTWKRYALSAYGLEKLSQSKPLAVSSFVDEENILEFDRLISDLVSRNNIARGFIDNLTRICLDFLRQRRSTGLIIGDITNKNTYVFRTLLPRQLFLTEAKRFLVRYCEIVDGYKFAYNFNSEGVLEGITRLKSEEECNPLLWANEQPYACLTSEEGVLGMRVCAENETFSIYANSEKVALFRNSVFNLNITANLHKKILELSRKHGINAAALERLCKIALRMSEMKKGALFVVGDANEILKASELPTYTDLQFSTASLNSLGDEEIVTLARHDGAIVLDKKGWIHGFGVILRPQTETKIDIFLDKGARHLAAAKIAKEQKSIAIVVSGGGPLSIIDEDKISIRLDM